MSPWMKCTSSMLTPISSATIWVMVVSMLCPWLPVPMYTLTLPLGSIRIVAAAAPPRRPGLRLDVQGQPDADQAAFGAGLLLLLAELVIADQLGGLLQASRPG